VSLAGPDGRPSPTAVVAGRVERSTSSHEALPTCPVPEGEPLGAAGAVRLAGIALSLISTSLDDGGLVPQSISGDPTAALQILYLISFSMLTLTGLVLSLVVVVVQLAMGVFSPRIVRQILQDRPSQAAIGLFAGTFTHSILAIREVRTSPDGGSVPGLAVVVAIVLVLACIGTLVWYLNHIGQSLRVAALVGWVADDTMRALDHVYPDPGCRAGTRTGPHRRTARRGRLHGRPRPAGGPGGAGGLPPGVPVGGR